MTQTFNPIIADERVQIINGIEGRYMGATVRHDEKPGCFCRQGWVTSKTIQYSGEPHQIKVKIRFDDDCRNGHNSFSITGEINSFDHRLRDRTVCCGCIHDEIAEHFPELAPLIKWHLVSSDGPLHYVANTTYHAGDLDHYGKRAGEPCAWTYAVKFGEFPILWRDKPEFIKWLAESNRADCEVIAIQHKDNDKPGKYQFGPKFTLGGAPDAWPECPFDTEREAIEFLEALSLGYGIVAIPSRFSEGKERQLDYARNSAVWPEATDEQLSLPKEELTKLLLDRLPGLMADFRATVEACGFLWEREA